MRLSRSNREQLAETRRDWTGPDKFGLLQVGAAVEKFGGEEVGAYIYAANFILFCHYHHELHLL